VQDNGSTRSPLPDRIRANHGKNLDPTHRALGERDHNRRNPLISKQVQQIIPIRMNSLSPTIMTFSFLPVPPRVRARAQSEPQREGARAPAALRPTAPPHFGLMGQHGPAQLLIVTNPEIMYAYGDFRCGCIRRITWGINRGYRLERHPRQSAQPLDGPAVRGSAGLPDSLGHKRDITSGRGCISRVDRCLAPGPRDFRSLSTHSHLIQVPRVTPVFRRLALCGRSRVPVTHRRSPRADRGPGRAKCDRAEGHAHR
jgi:hypothetical protein